MRLRHATGCLGLRAVALVLLGWAAACGVHAQAPAAVAEVLVKDMREEIVRIPVTVKDMYNRQETRPMPITIYRPAGEGPFPLVVFNHGRAITAKRAAQGRYRPEAAARYLVAKGFVVLVPTRVGYWETYGDFDPEQNGACNNMRVEPMSIAASDQVLATVDYAKTLAYVDASRWLVAGVSVGGLTSVATVARNPPGLLGGINFSGGTGGNPEASPERPCSPAAIASYWGGLAKTAPLPMLWLYWQNDKYWGEDVPKQWYKAWVGGGGHAEFKAFAAVGEDGHAGLNTDMDHWLPVVDSFLGQLGFNQPGIVARPVASGFATVAEVDKVPVSAQSRSTAYAKFLEFAAPRAFAVGPGGGWGYAHGDYATGRAIGNCQRSGRLCKLYAVDDDVVWRGP